MFTIHTRRCPDYFTDSVQACNSDPARTCLRSASSSDYSVPRARNRAFSVAGPIVWNSLPAAVREADSLHSFNRKLKTHLFTACFDDWLTVFFTNFCNAFPVWCWVGTVTARGLLLQWSRIDRRSELNAARYRCRSSDRNASDGYKHRSIPSELPSKFLGKSPKFQKLLICFRKMTTRGLAQRQCSSTTHYINDRRQGWASECQDVKNYKSS